MCFIFIYLFIREGNLLFVSNKMVEIGFWFILEINLNSKMKNILESFFFK